MKTIEEKLTASRAFLDTVCKPTYTIKHGIIARKANTTYSIQVRRKDSFADYFVIPHVGPAESEIVEIFHHLLGLSERDAVEDEKSRLLKRYKARIKRLRANDAETHRIQIEVKDEKMAALEAKNAALVDRIELALSMSEDIDINRILGNALAANEKGGNHD